MTAFPRHPAKGCGQMVTAVGDTERTLAAPPVDKRTLSE